jgi:sirohydrochlorin cobaltochelatase
MRSLSHTGLILFAHGARDPRWAMPFEAVAAHIRAARPDVPVKLAYLEFMPPTLPDAAAELVALGCGSVQVLPMFLGAGGHVRKDLPLLLDTVRSSHPGVTVSLATAIGEIDAVTQAMAKAALQLLEPLA